MQGTGDLKKLAAKTITNVMVRVLLDDARHEGRTDLAIACAKALRHPTSIRTLEDAAQRLAARTTCAGEINRRARAWLEHGAAFPSAYPRCAKYVELVQPHHAQGDPDASDK